jgi:hypothetical protein
VPAPTPTPTPTTTPDPTPSATPDPTPTAQAGGGGGAPGGGGSATGDQNSTAHGTPPELRSLKLLTAVACPRRTARCRAPGVALRIDLSAPARVRGTLRRRAPGSTRLAAFGSVRLGRVAAGPRTVRFTRTAAGRRLAPGAYKLRLTAAGSVRSLAFRVRAAR